MKIKKSILSNIGLIIFMICIAVFLLFIFTHKQPANSSLPTPPSIPQDSNDPNAQIINLTAKGGFNPSTLQAKANQNTILRVQTQNTFDCSSSISIPSIHVSRTLRATETVDINLGSQAPGTTIRGTCGMGMYSFVIKFS